MSHSCQTIKHPITDILLKEKGSKFIGFAYPVKDENEAKECLEKVKEIHPQATHHCYAYRIGYNGETYRANDDGEPSGSAGLPIYNQLLSSELSFVLVVIVRYYGGTKLGVSGLIKAYKSCTEITLAQAKFITQTETQAYRLQFPYELQKDITKILEKCHAHTTQENYTERCEYWVAVPINQEENFLNFIKPLYPLEAKKYEGT